MSAAATVNSSSARSEKILNLQQAFKLALSMALYYWLSLSLNWDEPQYGGLAIVIVSLATTGASIQKGAMRFVGTTVGVFVGFLILGLFNHDRWATMVAFAVYIAVLGYFMQTSRYSYAWYAAAFIPLVVWADTYPRFYTSFYFGTFRYLTTTAGIMIYTVVDIVLWPRHAGDRFNQVGAKLCAQVREQFDNYRGQLEQAQLPEGAAGLRPKLAGTLAQTMSMLQDAYFDTPEIGEQKRVWEAWRLRARGLVDALELWRESIDDIRELELDRLVPGLVAGLNTLDRRFERIDTLWMQRHATDKALESDDRPVLETLALDLNRAACADLSHFERAALTSFVAQLKLLDRTSSELLKTARVLAGIESSSTLRVSSHLRDAFQSSRWDPGRLIKALFPPVAFIAAFLFWVFMNPPSGQKVAMFAAVLALVFLRTPMNPLALMVVFVASIFVAVAPVYWLVMPGLSSGLDLLGLIFIYSFVFGYLGGLSPALKSGPIIMFVMMTGISNQQSYSFQGPVVGAQMVLYAGIIMTMAFYVFSPMRPEQELLRSLRRFFNGCARVTGGFVLAGCSQRDNVRRRKRYLESMVLPAPEEIHKASQQLNYKLYPDNSSEKVRRLYEALQSIVYRLEVLELAHNRIVDHSSEFPESLERVGSQVGKIAHCIFQCWANLESGDAFEEHRGSLQNLSRELEQQVDALTDSRDRDSISDQLRTDFYTVLGCVRGLIEAMANCQSVINQINWSQWATPRF